MPRIAVGVLEMFVPTFAAFADRHPRNVDPIVIDQLYPARRNDQIAVLDIAVRNPLLLEILRQGGEFSTGTRERGAIGVVPFEPEPEDVTLGPIHLDDRIELLTHPDAAPEELEAHKIRALKALEGS